MFHIDFHVYPRGPRSEQAMEALTTKKHRTKWGISKNRHVKFIAGSGKLLSHKYDVYPR